LRAVYLRESPLREGVQRSVFHRASNRHGWARQLRHRSRRPGWRIDTIRVVDGENGAAGDEKIGSGQGCRNLQISHWNLSQDRKTAQPTARLARQSNAIAPSGTARKYNSPRAARPHDGASCAAETTARPPPSSAIKLSATHHRGSRRTFPPIRLTARLLKERDFHPVGPMGVRRDLGVINSKSSSS